MKKSSILDNRRSYISSDDISRFKKQANGSKIKGSKIFPDRNSLDLCLNGSMYMQRDNFSITKSICKVKMKTKKSH